jgi:CelD/BcsL family acetyltransferase involved in cellulose biosynthesis
MDPYVEITRDIEPDAWGTLVNNSADATPFHLLSWISAWSQAFGFKPLFLVVRRENGDIVAGLPVLEELRLNVPIFREYHSLPWGCYGSVVVRDGIDASVCSSLLMRFLSLVKGRHVYRTTMVDFTGTGRFLADYASKTTKVFTHVLPLDRPFEEIYANYDYTIKKNIAKSKRNNVVVRDVRTLDEVDDYYDMTCAIAKKYDRPAYSRELFRSIYRFMVPRGEARFTLAFHDDKPLAGALHIIGHGQIFNWLTASYADGLEYRPNDALDSFMIEWASRNGVKSYNFGGSPSDATGLIRFKEKWGARKKSYQVYEIEGMPKMVKAIRRARVLAAGLLRQR